MTDVEVQIKGLKEMQQKLDGKFLLQPEVESRIRDKFIERVERRRKTVGFQRNPLQSERMPLSDGKPLAAITTPLNSPRTSGKSWREFVFSLVKGTFMERQINAAMKEIRARWSS